MWVEFALKLKFTNDLLNYFNRHLGNPHLHLYYDNQFWDVTQKKIDFF